MVTHQQQNMRGKTEVEAVVMLLVSVQPASHCEVAKGMNDKFTFHHRSGKISILRQLEGLIWCKILFSNIF